jgi:hypothetical protein
MKPGFIGCFTKTRSSLSRTVGTYASMAKVAGKYANGDSGSDLRRIENFIESNLCRGEGNTP